MKCEVIHQPVDESILLFDDSIFIFPIAFFLEKTVAIYWILDLVIYIYIYIYNIYIYIIYIYSNIMIYIYNMIYRYRYI